MFPASVQRQDFEDLPPPVFSPEQSNVSGGDTPGRSAGSHLELEIQAWHVPVFAVRGDGQVTWR